MKFGVCTSIDNAETARAAGFDFVEPTVRSLCPQEPDFDAIRAPFDSAPLPTPVFNVFVPAEIRLTGPEVNWAQVEGYLETAIGRVAAVGGKAIVFGSGGARRVPDGFPQNKAEDQLVRFLRVAGDVAVRSDVTIVIEPLNVRESNSINSVAAGMELAQRADHTQVRLLADLYHMMMDSEPLENITTCAQWLEHIHVADTDRGAPGTGSYPYEELFRRLHESGYKRRISVECRWDDFAAQAAESLTFLQHMWDETQ